MTLVHAKIMGMFVGQNQGVGVGGQGGYLKLFTSDCSTYIAVGRDGGAVGVGQ